MIRSILLLSALMPVLVQAGELPTVAVGPLSFENMPLQSAIEQVLIGTNIKSKFNGDFTGVVTATGVVGPLPEVMLQLSRSADFQYSFENNELVISKKKLTASESVSVAENESTLAKATNTKPKSEIATSVKIKEPVNPPFMGVKLKKGDNIHAAMEAAAKANHFTLNWDGEELYSKYDTSFESGTFEKSVDSLLTAIKVNGYISGNTIYVVVK